MTAKASGSGRTRRGRPRPPERSALAEGVRLTHPERTLFEDAGLTKEALADYFLAVAEWMLPHVAGRPLSLVRCPDGAGAKCFFQKHASPGFPKAIHAIRIAEKTGADDYLYVADRAGLVAAVQMDAVELHVWASRVDGLEKPDRMVFDFDPDEGLDFKAVKDAALEMRERLDAAGLASFPMATGGKGIHVVVPVKADGWEAFRVFAAETARAMAADSPDRYTAKAAKAERGGRIFIDYLRNGRGATAIAPYSSRNRPGAPVAWPLAWEEMGRLKSARPATVATAVKLIARRRDPWEGYFEAARTLPDGVSRG
jgi:bifunctional non-homologous end joining protein LigD